MGDLVLFEEGFLNKKGSLKQWKQCYCALENNKFTYRPQKGNISKELDMSNVHSVRAVRGKGNSGYEIHLHTRDDNKEFIFAAGNISDQERWVRSLQLAIDLKRKRDSLRTSIIEYNKREGTMYDQPWDLDDVQRSLSVKLNTSTKKMGKAKSMDHVPEEEFKRKGPPRIEPYAEVVLFPKPPKQTESVISEISPYAETGQIVVGSVTMQNNNDQSSSCVYSKAGDMYSEGNTAPGLYSKVDENAGPYSEVDSTVYDHRRRQAEKTPVFNSKPHTSTFYTNAEEDRNISGVYSKVRDTATSCFYDEAVYTPTYSEVAPPGQPPSEVEYSKPSYSKVDSLQPSSNNNENGSNVEYSYAKVKRRNFGKDVKKLGAKNVEKFRVAHSDCDTDTESENGLEPVVSSQSVETDNQVPDSHLKLSDAASIFSALQNYKAPPGLTYPDCRKSASFLELMKIVNSGRDRFPKPRSFKIGSYVSQLKKVVSEGGAEEETPILHVQMEMAL